MNSLLKYKGYVGSIEVDVKQNVLFGKILFINDLITFQANSPARLEEEFMTSVDVYLDTCEEFGKEPKKAFTGNLNIRIPTKTHEALAYKAVENEYSINFLISRTLDAFVNGATVGKIIHNHHNTYTFSSEYPLNPQPRANFESSHLQLVNLP